MNEVGMTKNVNNLDKIQFFFNNELIIMTNIDYVKYGLYQDDERMSDNKIKNKWIK